VVRLKIFSSPVPAVLTAPGATGPGVNIFPEGGDIRPGARMDQDIRKNTPAHPFPQDRIPHASDPVRPMGDPTEGDLSTARYQDRKKSPR